MFWFRASSQSIRRAQAKPSSSSLSMVAIAWGLVVPLVVSCSQSGQPSTPPTRELTSVATGVGSGDGVESGDEALETPTPSCRTMFDLELAQSESAQQSSVQLILDAVRVAQADDERCGQRRIEEIYCRALWLLEVLDPVVIAFDPSVSPDERLEAAASLDWALRTAVDAPTVAAGATSAEEPVALEGPSSITGEGDVLVVSVGNGFAQLRPLTSRLAEALKGVDATSRLTAEDEEHLALLIKARAHPTILEPLSAMQTACLLGT